MRIICDGKELNNIKCSVDFVSAIDPRINHHRNTTTKAICSYCGVNAFFDGECQSCGGEQSEAYRFVGMHKNEEIYTGSL